MVIFLDSDANSHFYFSSSPPNFSGLLAHCATTPNFRFLPPLQCQIHELTKQQTATIEQVVPWFLNTMPPAYFRQVPETFRLDHIKAVSAIRDANMDLYLNLQSHLSDGRLVLTFIRPGTQPGLLLQMVKDLPWNHFQGGDEHMYLPLTRVQVFSALDESMSLNMFVYGDEVSEPFDVTVAGARILEYADAALTSDVPDEIPQEICERQGLIDYMKKCSENYITRSDPRRYLQQRMLFERVSGTEGTAVHVEVRMWLDIKSVNISAFVRVSMLPFRLRRSLSFTFCPWLTHNLPAVK
jgi:hypothetical protein